jgi:hypothetical protein
MTGFPFYLFEPMRLLILSYLLFTNNKHNSYFLAIFLPLISFLIAGHPTLFKMPLVSLDLIVNLVVFSAFLSKKLNIYFSITFSIIISKMIYYLFKILFVNVGLLHSGYVETDVIYQIFNILILVLIAAVFSKIKKNY